MNIKVKLYHATCNKAPKDVQPVMDLNNEGFFVCSLCDERVSVNVTTDEN